ncbi:MAG: Glu/Leu/Phe/Val dehydrogenase [Candidatus Cardinium sp.]|uniref:Glu/Leu/Phe/Val family dehydrogenase n=1 Tax=Cardinium endosymbiont of Dermatophagoides farinae TaxID=2597823 RepID=UPI0011843852|nr:Glu/Leu/Phe/Val dehydrogenase dimerization domain-containing protein [Cardinium endosymbiont of Dermatophagoides farinae]TSJ80727.1 Glu/Leu/Phe/Val dehydrogenase [Cardinium endosymbiont of Dermatophagoides farinae]UWW96725.1 MAG: Glu/Leu/Phe/Val dehydrogenase [Candidatus Cardinium sp.]
MKIIEQPFSNYIFSNYPNDSTHFSQKGHEQVVYFQDEATGLQAIVAIHDTTLGPAVGGLRFFEYQDEREALKDVLRLSRGMTYKASIAGLDFGGGKAVLIKKKGSTLTEALLRKYGSFIERLGGHYITAPDYNTTMEDMVAIAKSTRHVIGLPIASGGSGDPSENTAYGVYIAMKATAKQTFGRDSLVGKKIGIAGIGKVGYFLAQLLCQEGAIVYVADICPKRLQAITEACKVEVVPVERLYSWPLDIYAPCALGATLNSTTIPMLNCATVVGAANNQLADQDQDGKLLLKRGIVYTPDFLANAGGLINAVTELETTSQELVKKRTEQLYTICLDVLDKAAKTARPTQEVAQEMAIERIQSIKNAKFGK